ncbi:Smr/MutS family protein [Halobacteriovorax sp. HLS]|uniref:endonuclease MutS2 n=1 Tax=Halobacteriovorax sp. HLS TaxID=2234000 RepID=UPI000FD9922C|nr:Smr/MutS family protein [Halobacteriovorax sp. HLS]
MALNLLKKNSKFLEYLDWNEILEILLSYSYFDYTKEKLKNLLEYRNNDEINAELNLIDQYIDQRDNYDIHLKDVFECLPSTNQIETYLKAIQKGVILNLAELNSVCKLLETYSTTQKYFQDFNITHEHCDQGTKSKIRNNFVNPFRKLVYKNGEEHLENHPIISKLYKEVKELEFTLRQQVMNISREEKYTKALQLNEYDIINDRYVLAVRSDTYNSELGVIIAKSNTGMTLFVEPYPLREKSNLRIRLLAQVDAIINEICQGFCSTLLTFDRTPLNILHFYFKLDLLKTKSGFSESLNLCRPTLNIESKIDIKGFFHPLIENPILNDISIGPSKKGLIISGPNTGGKTVTLKSVSICLLMSYMGLYVPAQSCDLYLPEGLYYFSHDQQDLSSGLSSFASEAKNYLELLKDIEPTSIIIVDEIFNSTSSEEASALAISFLEEIHKKSDAKVIISTHHQFFKTYIHSSKDYISSHVGFDVENSKPTYKLLFGSPGSSMAFQIFEILASKFNLINSISERAEKILDRKQVSYEQLLQELSGKKSELDRLLLENRQLNNELKNKNKSMEGLVHLEKERLVNEYKKKLNKVISKAEHLLHETRKGNIKNEKHFSKKVSTLSDELPDPRKTKFAQALAVDYKEDPISISSVSIGDQLLAKPFNKVVTVQSINERKKEIQVLNGKMSIWMASKNLYPTHHKRVAKEVQINITRTVHGKLEIDGRGLRLEEFQRLVEDTLHELISGDIPFLNIVHGHGEGVLKKWLRGYLTSFKEIEFSSEEGNDGATRVTLI